MQLWKCFCYKSLCQTNNLNVRDLSVYELLKCFVVYKTKQFKCIFLRTSFNFNKYFFFFINN